MINILQHARGTAAETPDTLTKRDDVGHIAAALRCTQYGVFAAEGWYRDTNRHLVRQLPDLHEDATILDVGCGSGESIAALCERYQTQRIMGIDTCPSMIDEARHRHCGNARIHLHTSSLDDMGTAGPVPHCITAMNMIHYLDADAKRAFLTQAVRLLPSGGTLGVSTAFSAQAQRSQGTYAALFGQALGYAIRDAYGEAGYAAAKPHLKRKDPCLEDYARLLEEAGLRIETAALHPQPITIRGLRLFFRTEEVARHTLPVFPAEEASAILARAIDEATSGVDEQVVLPRDWAYVVGRKP